MRSFTRASRVRKPRRLSSERRSGAASMQRARDAVAQGAGLGAHAAAVHRGDDVHARLVADRLERLADRALQRGPREEDVERLAVDRVRAVARLEDHARHGGLALAGRGVAGAGGQVDRRIRDRLGEVLLAVAGLAGLVVVLAVEVLAAQGLLALADDVDLEVGARDQRLHAGSGLLVVLAVVLLGGCGLGGLGRGRVGLGRGRGLLGSGLGGGLLVGGGLLGSLLLRRLGRRLLRSLRAPGPASCPRT